MDENAHDNHMDDRSPIYDLHLKDYIKRLEFARDNGCNNAILTGTGEPQQNRRFLTDFGLFMMLMERPFRNIEMQTTGVLLDDAYLRFLRNHVGVNTISLSVSALDDSANSQCNGTAPRNAVKLEKLCSQILQYDFNLRLCLNMTSWFDYFSASNIVSQCSTYGANQITFRVLYQSPKGDKPQDLWIQKNGASPGTIIAIKEHIKTNGKPLERLEYGQIRYAVDGMSVVLDDDCMAQEIKESLKYLILRPDCRLYSRWDDKASLVF